MLINSVIIGTHNYSWLKSMAQTALHALAEPLHKIQLLQENIFTTLSTGIINNGNDIETLVSEQKTCY